MLSVEVLSVDATSPRELAAFWEAVLGWRRYNEDDQDNEDDEEILLRAPDGVPGGVNAILFLPVPEAKAIKNRLHLDLRPDDQDAEVARLESLGATKTDVGQKDVTWVVLADPEGNEFCVLRAHSDAGGASGT
jgi:predicted enzyme related to lactoylglutathione lyase